jgi:hypothetical protein
MAFAPGWRDDHVRITPDRVWRDRPRQAGKPGGFPFYRFHLAARSRCCATAS